MAKPGEHDGRERFYLEDLQVGQQFTSGSPPNRCGADHGICEASSTRSHSTSTTRRRRGTLFGGLAASGWHTAAGHHAAAGGDRVAACRWNSWVLAARSVGRSRPRRATSLHLVSEIEEVTPLPVPPGSRDGARSQRDPQSARRSRSGADREARGPTPHPGGVRSPCGPLDLTLPRTVGQRPLAASRAHVRRCRLIPKSNHGRAAMLTRRRALAASAAGFVCAGTGLLPVLERRRSRSPFTSSSAFPPAAAPT